MAQKYNDDFIRSVAEGRVAAPTPYVARLARNYGKGVSRAQAAGHARAHKGEQPVSAIRGTRGSRSSLKQAPKITKRVVNLPRNGKLITTYKTGLAYAQIEKLAARRGSKEARVYLQVWDPHTGQFVDIYRGGRNNPHGITASHLAERIKDQLNLTGATLDEAFRQVLAGDSEEGADSAGNEDEAAAPLDFTQVRLYVLPA